MANFNKSLSAQAAQLGRNLQSREKRRNTDRFRNNEIDDVYEDMPRKRPNSTGGVSLGPAAAALAAVSAASALPGPEIIRCNLCQVRVTSLWKSPLCLAANQYALQATFTSKAQEQQHIAGPVHRKAVRKLEEEELKRQRMGVYSEVAQAALQAAAWQASQGQTLPAAPASAPGGPGNHTAPASAQRNRQPDAQGAFNNARPNKVPEGAGARPGIEPPPARGKRGVEQIAKGERNAERTQPMGLSHQQLVAQARGQQEPLSIGGWIPPSIPTVMTRRPSQSSQSASALPGSSQQLIHTSREEQTEMGSLQPAAAHQDPGQPELHHRHGQAAGTQRDSHLEGAAEATATTAMSVGDGLREQSAGVGTSGLGADGGQEAPWGGLVDYSDDDEGVDSEQGEEEGGAPGQQAGNDQHMLGIPAPDQGASDDSDTDEEDSESDGEPITSFF